LLLLVADQEVNGVVVEELEVLELLLVFQLPQEEIIQSQLELELRQFKRLVTAMKVVKVLILHFPQ
jgi:hypothetical protein